MQGNADFSEIREIFKKSQLSLRFVDISLIFALMREKEIKKPLRASEKLPTRFVPVGGKISRYGFTLTAVLRPPVAKLLPCEACSGCWFAKGRVSDELITNCSDIQCSRWDRMDGQNVWFKLEGEV